MSSAFRHLRCLILVTTSLANVLVCYYYSSKVSLVAAFVEDILKYMKHLAFLKAMEAEYLAQLVKYHHRSFF